MFIAYLKYKFFTFLRKPQKINQVRYMVCIIVFLFENEDRSDIKRLMKKKKNMCRPRVLKSETR